MTSSFPLLTGDGTLETQKLVSFLAANGADQWNKHYVVVAVMGPQSSGKSTLMNHVFGTEFTEMNHEKGRSQTTRGVWMARAEKPNSFDSTDANKGPKPILVLDLEGTDGRERGEDDTSFEKQTALFAMASADVLMVNMWCNDLGREVASGKPLLKVVFQVNLKLFTPKKTTLLFVIRDKSRTPEDKLLETLTEDLSRIWASITKPERHARSKFTDFFDLKFVALSHFEHAHEQFVSDCDALREKFFTDETETNNPHNAPVARQTSEPTVPASGLAVSLREAWKAIQENRDLDLPKHGVMVATVRCEEIGGEIVERVVSGKKMVNLVELAEKSDPGTAGISLGAKVAEILNESLLKYDEEAKFFDPEIARAKRKTLTHKIRKLAAPAVSVRLKKVSGFLLKNASSKVGNKGNVSFSEVSQGLLADSTKAWSDTVADACPKTLESETDEEDDDEDAITAQISLIAEAFTKDLNLVITTARRERISGCVSVLEKQAERAVAAAVDAALDDGSHDLWDGINESVGKQCAKTVKALASALGGFKVSQQEVSDLRVSLTAKTHVAAELKIKDVTSDTNVVTLMKNQFSKSFSKDSRGLPKVWRAEDDVGKQNNAAQKQAVRVLALLSVNRLIGDLYAQTAVGTGGGDKSDGRATSDKSKAAETEARSMAAIEQTLVDHFVPKIGDEDDETIGTNAQPVTERKKYPTEWEGVSDADNKVLLDPGRCRQIWKRFESDVQYVVSQAVAARDAAKRGGGNQAPVWMYFALLMLGMDEVFWLVRNPVTLLFLVLLGLFLKAVYQRMDAETAMRMGFVPGIMFLATKVVPAVLGVVAKLVEDGRDAHGLRRDESTTGVGGNAGASPAAKRAGGDATSARVGVSSEGVSQRRAGTSTMMYPGE